MSGITAIVQNQKIPPFVRVRQSFDQRALSQEEIRRELTAGIEESGLLQGMGPGKRVVLTAGSRGIANLSFITRILVEKVKATGAEPIIIPAMGSHGGATAEGQREVLAGYGITEESMGCRICSSMETVQIGQAGTLPVFIDRIAAGCDGIIVVNRIKAHTGFRGEYESGLLKMLTIGLGKQKGAAICHADGFKYMAQRIPLIGKEILRRAPVLFGVALLENAYEQTCRLTVLPPDEIIRREPELLREAKKNMGRLFFSSCDILLVRQIGKNFSGDGMDPNVTGRFCSECAQGGIQARRIGILDLADASHGNATGMGKADIASRRFFEKLSFDATYPNFITTGSPFDYKMPIIVDNDREVLQTLLNCCQGMDKNRPKIILINNSLELERILITPWLLEETTEPERVQAESLPFDLEFDDAGNLLTEI